jgi:uncharacterized repeat protein (TIGR02543 family)
MLDGRYRNNRNAPGTQNLQNGVLYIGLEKAGNDYVALDSVDGLLYQNSDGRFGPTEPRFSFGPPLRNLHIGLMASKANAGLPDLEFYVEYIAIQTADGVSFLSNQEMMQYAVDNVLSYVAADVPTIALDSFELSPIPTGYTMHVTSDKPDVISNTGSVVRPTEQGETVSYTIEVSDGARTAGRTLSINVPKVGWENISTVTFLVDNEVLKTVELEKGETVARPDDPVKEGYVFIGWFDGKEEFDFDTPVTADLILTAVFELIPITSIRINAIAIETVRRGQVRQFTLTLNEGASDAGIVWTTANQALATVTDNGLVTVKNVIGTVILTATDLESGRSHSVLLRIAS